MDAVAITTGGLVTSGAVRDRRGLTIFLSTRLIEWDRMSLQGLVFGVLGTDTDVHIAEYTETGENSCRVRLTGSDPDDLVKVAEHVANVTWRTAEKHTLKAAGLLQVAQVTASLDHMRQHLERMEQWAQQSGIREMLEGQAAEHTRKEDVALMRTWERRALDAVWGRMKKKVGNEVADAAKAGVKGLLPGGERPE